MKGGSISKNAVRKVTHAAMDVANQYQKQFNDLHAMQKAKMGERAPDAAIQFNHKAFVKRMVQAKFGTSCYTPHQGSKECERRLRQMKKGIIAKDQIRVCT